MNRMIKSLCCYTLAASLVPLLSGCDRQRSEANAQAVADTIGSVHRSAVLSSSATPYQVTSVTTPGRVSGTVLFEGAPAGDTLIQVAADQNGCGKPLVIRRLDRSGGKVAGAVVWITDVRAGRALPLDRRFELENNDCAWDPMVQAVVANGGLNVVNSDPLVERAYATNVATGDTTAVAPFTDQGQVIPYDRMLRTPGVYEFSVESRPMSRAWVAVFDQPYFTVTKGDGAFVFEGVPVGAHTVRAWHPLLGVADGTVTVDANGSATLTLRFK